MKCGQRISQHIVKPTQQHMRSQLVSLLTNAVVTKRFYQAMISLISCAEMIETGVTRNSWTILATVMRIPNGAI